MYRSLHLVRATSHRGYSEIDSIHANHGDQCVRPSFHGMDVGKAMFVLLLLIVSGLRVFFGVSLAQAGEVRPNIIFFLTDDQRFDHLGCAGDPVVQTPNMDRLASQGTRFTNAFVTTPICAASRATMFTGLYERTHKYTFGTPPLAKSMTDHSYPALLRQAGYRTGFVGKFGVAVQRGVPQEMFDFFVPLNRSPYLKRQPDGSLRHTIELTGDHAVKFLRGQKADQPFCLSLSFNAPHAEDADKQAQYPSPKAVAGLYDELTIADPPLSDPAIFDSQPDFLKRSLNRQRWYWRWDTPEKYQKNVKGYYRMITGIDRVIGRVLQEVADRGLSDNTIVLFASDNGYYRGSRGFAGKWSHYEESLRIPMIIADPREPVAERGRLSDKVVLNVDIPATILDLASVKVPDSYEGVSLQPLLSGQSPVDWRTDFFCEHLMHYPVGLPKWEGVRDQRWVYARYFEQQPVYEFLHDLQTDPQQLRTSRPIRSRPLSCNECASAAISCVTVMVEPTAAKNSRWPKTTLPPNRVRKRRRASPTQLRSNDHPMCSTSFPMIRPGPTSDSWGIL